MEVIRLLDYFISALKQTCDNSAIWPNPDKDVLNLHLGNITINIFTPPRTELCSNNFFKGSIFEFTNLDRHDYIVLLSHAGAHQRIC